jgi:hypothetical protein
MSIIIDGQAELVKLSCTLCGHTEDMARHCPLTGHHYGEGFEYVCPICRGPMKANDNGGNKS